MASSYSKRINFVTPCIVSGSCLAFEKVGSKIDGFIALLSWFDDDDGAFLGPANLREVLHLKA